MCWRSERRDTSAMSWPSIVIDAALGLVEAQQQIEHRRLAAAGRADQRGQLAGLGHEGHAAQDRLVAAIGEVHVVELERAVVICKRRLVVVDAARSAGCR